MTGNKPSTAHGLIDPDDAPDLSTDEWRAKFAQVSVKRGRPPVDAPKVPVTIRLDADLVARLRASGQGWQSRVNEALRKVEGI